MLSFVVSKPILDSYRHFSEVYAKGCRGVDGHVEGLMQYSREEVWYKLGKLINQLDADGVFFPETHGFVVSSIIKGKIILI